MKTHDKGYLLQALLIPLWWCGMVLSPTVYGYFEFPNLRREPLKILRGILPICANCESIRNEEGEWERVETYVRQHSEANFSHGICPDCRKKLYPDF